MSGALRAVEPGLHVTLQDAGRFGWRRFGVSVCGPMDPPALSLANALVGNPPDAAALEFAHAGGTWEIAAESCRVAVTGGAFVVLADGVPLPAWQSHTLRQGQHLSVKGARDAVWGYLAVAGGFDIPMQLGSCATHLRSGLGGVAGRCIGAGDVLPLRAARAANGRERRVPPPNRTRGPLRVVLGPQQDYFSPETVAAFLAETYRVSNRSDRMGMWLEGPPVSHAQGFNVLTDGLVPGCIQVPGSGQPVVLLMDCQTVGGYPKLATVITADLPRLTQSRPGTPVTFAAIDIEAAQGLYRAYRSVFAEIGRTAQEVPDVPLQPPWLRM